MNKSIQPKIIAVLTGAILLLLSVISLLCILLPRSQASGYIADIYQEGKLLASISLADVETPYTFTVTGVSGCKNEVEVRPGSIGIITADCPDKLCVHQGFISDSRLPITCLPNRLVIQLRPENQENIDSITADMITY